ncbi:SNARE domain anchored protein [Nitzschia inconspicua]|uniref:SNARE domain anchored protein n=1 Tax=Nitzschia inconspicua TaxID=303405 RepID=A0A9K3PYD4_9STRA|nr:SNARE domain anchored protein [Nitzschia inconspicua]
MTDIQYWEDTLTEEIEAIQNILDGVPSLSNPVQRASAMEEADDRLRGAAGTKRSFKMEIRLVQDIKERRRLEGNLQKMDQELRTLKADLKALQADENRGELFVSGGAGNGDNGEVDPSRAGSNMLNEAAALQDKTQDSLQNTRNMIAASKEVGVSTLEELQRQREVINNIDKEADRLDDNLARAEALMKQFGKRMAGDKFIQCFAVINSLLLLGVIIYAIMKKGAFDGNSDEPPNPASRMLRSQWEG